MPIRKELVNQLIRSSGNRKNKRLGCTFAKSRNRTEVSFRRSVLQGEESAILDDGWFHCLGPRQVLAGFLCCDKRFFLAGWRSRIIYFETQRKVGALA